MLIGLFQQQNQCHTSYVHMYCFRKAEIEKIHCHSFFDYVPNYGKSAKKRKNGRIAKVFLYTEYLCLLIKNA